MTRKNKMYIEINYKKNNGQEYTMFINLKKEKLEEEIKCLIKEAKKIEDVKRIRYTSTKLTNW